MKYGLTEQAFHEISGVFSLYPQIESVVIYGSRAKGDYRPNSDIDLALKGKELDLTLLFKIENDLDDLMLPYKIDLSIYHSIEDKNLLEHIDRVGIVFYEKECSEEKKTGHINLTDE